MATKRPTQSQRAALDYFANRSADERGGVARVTTATYRACRARGQLVETNVFPFHEITSAGREVLAQGQTSRTLGD